MNSHARPCLPAAPLPRRTCSHPRAPAPAAAAPAAPALQPVWAPRRRHLCGSQARLDGALCAGLSWRTPSCCPLSCSGAFASEPKRAHPQGCCCLHGCGSPCQLRLGWHAAPGYSPPAVCCCTDALLVLLIPPAPPRSPELDLVVSGAADGSILLHSLGTGRYVRSLALPLGVPPTLLRLVPSIGELPQIDLGGNWCGLQGGLLPGRVIDPPACAPAGPPRGAPFCQGCLLPSVDATLQALFLCTLTSTFSCTCTLSTAGTWPRQARARVAARAALLLAPAAGAQRRGQALPSACFACPCARRRKHARPRPPSPQTRMSGWRHWPPPPTAACFWQPAPAAWPPCAGCTPSR